MRAVWQYLKRLWADERGIVGLGGLAASLFNIGGGIGGLFGGQEESEGLKKLERHMIRSARRQDQLQGLMGPFNQLMFQNLEQTFGLRPEGDFDLGLLGIDVPGLEQFVDPRSAKKVAKLQDKIANLEHKRGLRVAGGKGSSAIGVKIQKLRDQITGLTEGMGLPEDVVQEMERIQAGIGDPFDIARAAEQGGLAQQQQSVIRQIQESVPPGGLREKLLADAATQFGLQRGLLETQDDIFRRNFIAGFPGFVERDFLGTIGPGVAGQQTQLQSDLATLAGIQGSGTALASGLGGIGEFLEQFGGKTTPQPIPDADLQAILGLPTIVR